MIRRNHEYVVCLHCREETCKPVIELLHCACIARNVAAVAVDHIAVDEIDEGQPREVLCEERGRLPHAVGICLIDAE